MHRQISFIKIFALIIGLSLLLESSLADASAASRRRRRENAKARQKCEEIVKSHNFIPSCNSYSTFDDLLNYYKNGEESCNQVDRHTDEDHMKFKASIVYTQNRCISELESKFWKEATEYKEKVKKEKKESFQKFLLWLVSIIGVISLGTYLRKIIWKN